MTILDWQYALDFAANAGAVMLALTLLRMAYKAARDLHR